MSCSKCQSKKIFTTICEGEEISSCWGCGFLVTKQVDCPDCSEVKVKPMLDGAKKAMSGADAVDAMQAEK